MVYPFEVHRSSLAGTECVSSLLLEELDALFDLLVACAGHGKLRAGTLQYSHRSSVGDESSDSCLELAQALWPSRNRSYRAVKHMSGLFRVSGGTFESVMLQSSALQSDLQVHLDDFFRQVRVTSGLIIVGPVSPSKSR